MVATIIGSERFLWDYGMERNLGMALEIGIIMALIKFEMEF